MDDLPKNQNSDLSAYAGVYPPADQNKSATPMMQTEPVLATAPSVGQSPPVAPVNDVPPAPVMSTVPTPASEIPPPLQQAPSVSEPTVYTPNIPTVSEVTPQGTDATFTISGDDTATTPAKSSGSGNGMVKRILVIIILLIGVILGAFVIFRVLSGFFAGRQPVTLQYWGLWEDEQLMTPLITEYKNTHPNVDIVYSKQNPKQYRERLQAAIERGEGPDLYRYHNSWVPMMVNQLAPAGKTGYTTAEFKEAFYAVATKDLIVNGEIYGAPLMFDGLSLYYNEDLLSAAGVTPPTSWEDFRTAAIAMTVKDETGQIVTAGAALGTANNIEHFSDIVALMMLQNGTDLKNPNSEEGKGALSFYQLFAQPPNNVWDTTLDNSILAFANGKVAFIFAPSWEVFAVKQINPDLKFQVIPVPQLPGATTTWASYWVEGVSSKSNHKDEAWEFLKFLSSKESLISLYTEESKTRSFGEPYSRPDLAQTIMSDPYVGAYIQQAQTAQSFFLSSRTHDGGINDRMIKYLEDAINSLSQGVSVEAALETMSQGFSQVLASFTSAPISP